MTWYPFFLLDAPSRGFHGRLFPLLPFLFLRAVGFCFFFDPGPAGDSTFSGFCLKKVGHSMLLPPPHRALGRATLMTQGFSFFSLLQDTARLLSFPSRPCLLGPVYWSPDGDGRRVFSLQPFLELRRFSPWASTLYLNQSQYPRRRRPARSARMPPPSAHPLFAMVAFPL